MSPTIEVAEPGYYWVAVTDDNGCTATSEIIQLGASTLIPDTASICVVSVESYLGYFNYDFDIKFN